MTDPADTQPHDVFHETIGHVVPLRFLAAIFAALIALTFITVFVTYWDFGKTPNLIIALAVAVIKASLVALYFMHLRWDSPFNSLVLIASFVFVAIIIAFALIDSFNYSDNLINTPDPSRISPG